MIITDKEKLKHACEPVSSFDEAMEIIDKLEQELERSPITGIGLAANQIGINEQVFIIRVPADDNIAERPYTLGYNFVNPKIVNRKIPFIMKNEGCLSFPDETVRTLRYGQVKVEDFLSPEGRNLRGLAAVVCQHETDHLHGITMYERQLSTLTADALCPCESGKEFKRCCAVMMRNNKVL